MQSWQEEILKIAHHAMMCREAIQLVLPAILIVTVLRELIPKRILLILCMMIMEIGMTARVRFVLIATQVPALQLLQV